MRPQLQQTERRQLMNNLETDRLVLRNWQDGDAEDLFLAAKNPIVGPMCGWDPHKDATESLFTIRNILNSENCFALVLKETGKPVGSIELMTGEKSRLSASDSEAELGYWLAEEYWGRGLMPEAADRIIEYGFSGLDLSKIWCAARSYNSKSLRVQEKCGFSYVRFRKSAASPTSAPTKASPPGGPATSTTASSTA